MRGRWNAQLAKDLAIALQLCFPGRVDAAVLDPVKVRVDGRAVPPGRPKQRTLLTMLLLHGSAQARLRELRRYVHRCSPLRHGSERAELWPMKIFCR
jgi:hypothetical protein